MSEEVSQPEKEFSADYVKQLRDENASWRKRTRELEAKVQFADVSMEFARRGINADPSWVKLEEGKSISDAVDQFAAQYPQLIAQSSNEPQVRVPNVPAPLPHSQNNANQPGPPAQGQLINRDLEAIKQDPKARQQLREEYRSMLTNASYQKDNTY